MENKKTSKQELIDRIVRKRKFLTGVGVVGASLVTAGMLSTIGCAIGSMATDISGSEKFDNIKASVGGTAEYIAFTDQRKQQLKEDFYNGKLSYSDFKVQYESDNTIESIREFADETNNQILQSQLRDADKTNQKANDILTYGVMGSVAGVGVGFATFGIADAFDKKYRRDLNLLDAKESEMAD